MTAGPLRVTTAPAALDRGRILSGVTVAPRQAKSPAAKRPAKPTAPPGCWRCTDDHATLRTYTVETAGKALGMVRLCDECIAEAQAAA